MKAKTTFNGFKPKGFIFDFDGTIADSMEVWDYVGNTFFERHEMKNLDLEDYNEAIVALGFQAGAQLLVESGSVDMTADEIVAEWYALSEEVYAEKVVMKPYVLDYLQALQDQGFRMTIATSLNRNLLEEALKRNNADQYFDALLLCDELASNGKFEPTVYCAAADALGLELSDCVVFEDVSIGAGTARDAGAFVVGVHDVNGREWSGKLEKASNMCIKSFSELLIDEK